jgi:hypothetical protein
MNGMKQKKSLYRSRNTKGHVRAWLASSYQLCRIGPLLFSYCSNRVGFVDEAVLETELTSLDPAIQFKSEILTR